MALPLRLARAEVRGALLTPLRFVHLDTLELDSRRSCSRRNAAVAGDCGFRVQAGILEEENS